VSVIPPRDVISFARGVPSPDMFPVERLAECARRAIERVGRIALNYGPPAGYGPLREWIADSHGVEPGRVLITPGSLQGLGFVAREVVGRGGAAIVESPTYDRMLTLLSELDATVDHVPRDLDGLDLDRLRAITRAGARGRLLYVLPTFHNPTGTTLGLAAREALLDVVLQRGLTVFEDDPYGLLRVEGEAPPSLLSLARDRGADEHVIHASSFSKTVAPGLRVGYLVLPPALVPPLEHLATRTYLSPPLLPQAELHEFLIAGLLDDHLEYLRAFLRERRDALLGVLDGELDRGASFTRPEGGYFLWLRVPGADLDALVEPARAAGVAFVPGSSFHPNGNGGAETARLSYSYPAPDEIREGARRLARLLQNP
jgi:DNA-binding transcriptional MocR family regulator